MKSKISNQISAIKVVYALKNSRIDNSVSFFIMYYCVSMRGRDIVIWALQLFAFTTLPKRTLSYTHLGNFYDRT